MGVLPSVVDPGPDGVTPWHRLSEDHERPPVGNQEECEDVAFTNLKTLRNLFCNSDTELAVRTLVQQAIGRAEEKGDSLMVVHGLAR